MAGRIILGYLFCVSQHLAQSDQAGVAAWALACGFADLLFDLFDFSSIAIGGGGCRWGGVQFGQLRLERFDLGSKRDRLRCTGRTVQIGFGLRLEFTGFRAKVFQVRAFQRCQRFGGVDLEAAQRGAFAFGQERQFGKRGAVCYLLFASSEKGIFFVEAISVCDRLTVDVFPCLLYTSDAADE